MKTMYKIGAATLVSTSLLASTAFAGSLVGPVVETVPTAVYEPAFTGGDWTGAYGGLNLGYGDVDGSGTADGNDMTYGLHLGYSYDFGRYVIGGEFEYDDASIDLNGAAETDSVMRLKLRGGYDLGRAFLVYALFATLWAKSHRVLSALSNAASSTVIATRRCPAAAAPKLSPGMTAIWCASRSELYAC